ncbi:response regulator [uncultured Jatrophihabitans sp.]|uniref:response regulator n=1 Tax=uncultured Jatrophihabitans sp. TaxID=1610747 RepID=UPI0035CC87D5
MITVLLVDDHPIVLSGLAALVQSDDGLELQATARSVAEASAVTATPDVALVDLDLPDGDGISLGASLKARWPAARVVVLTMHADDKAVIRSLGAGLDGYLLKDADPEDILAAIHTVARGTMVLGRGTTAAVVAAAAVAPRTDGLARLDARELEILELLVQGLTTSQVAARLFLAPKTIRNRVSDLVGKLGVASREDAIEFAKASGIGPRR